MKERNNGLDRILRLQGVSKVRYVLAYLRLSFGMQSLNRWLVGYGFRATKAGGMAERSKAADCKSADERLRRFESCSLHQCLWLCIQGSQVEIRSKGCKRF